MMLIKCECGWYFVIGRREVVRISTGKTPLVPILLPRKQAESEYADCFLFFTRGGWI